MGYAQLLVTAVQIEYWHWIAKIQTHLFEASSGWSGVSSRDSENSASMPSYKTSSSEVNGSIPRGNHRAACKYNWIGPWLASLIVRRHATIWRFKGYQIFLLRPLFTPRFRSLSRSSTWVDVSDTVDGSCDVVDSSSDMVDWVCDWCKTCWAAVNRTRVNCNLSLKIRTETRKEVYL